MNSPLPWKRFSAAIALPLLTFAVNAGASNIQDPSVSILGIINNSAVQIDGTILSFGTASAGVYTIDVFAGAGECVRLDVTTQPADLELVVVAPDGTVYRNDDRPGDLRPLVQIAAAPNNGWYTVHVASFFGGAIEGNFTMLYGRYNNGNANCVPATPPTLTSQSIGGPTLLDEESATEIKLQTTGETTVEPPKAKSPGSR
jgi:hypothetical protein